MSQIGSYKSRITAYEKNKWDLNNKVVSNIKKGLIIFFIVLGLLVLFSLFSCTDEYEIKEYESKWRWNVKETPIRYCSGFDKDLEDVDIIKIELESDLGGVYNYTDYKIKDNQLILEAPVKYQTEDFDNPELMRLTIKLICYD